MFSVPTEAPAAVRARWLADLSDALERAQRLLTELDSADAGTELLDLRARIDAARLEIQSLRLIRSGIPREEVDPNWSGFIAWKAGESSSLQRPSGRSPPPRNGSR